MPDYLDTHMNMNHPQHLAQHNKDKIKEKEATAAVVTLEEDDDDEEEEEKGLTIDETPAASGAASPSKHLMRKCPVCEEMMRHEGIVKHCKVIKKSNSNAVINLSFPFIVQFYKG